MPPPPSIPRETRSQSRKSRLGSDGVESVGAPVATLQALTTPRRKPNVRAKPSSNYGAALDAQQAPAQKQAVRSARGKVTDRIEAGVNAAMERSAAFTTTATTTNATRGLTAVKEEYEHEAVQGSVSPRRQVQVAFNNRGDENEAMSYRQPTRAIPQQPTALNLPAAVYPYRASASPTRAFSKQTALNSPAPDRRSASPMRAFSNQPALISPAVTFPDRRSASPIRAFSNQPALNSPAAAYPDRAFSRQSASNSPAATYPDRASASPIRAFCKQSASNLPAATSPDRSSASPIRAFSRQSASNSPAATSPDRNSTSPIRAFSRQPASNSSAAGSPDRSSASPIRTMLNQPAALNQSAAANQDAASAQSVHPNVLPVPLQSPILQSNSPVTTATRSHGGVPMPWILKGMWLAFIVSLIVTISSAAFSIVRYQQITTSLSDFQSHDGKKVSSIIPPGFIERLDKLEGQVSQLENEATKEARSHQINWFSFDVGARANPYMSSATTRSAQLETKSRWSLEWKDIKSAWKSSSGQEPVDFLRPVSGKGGRSSTSRSGTDPNKALTPFKEFEPRFCGPSSGRGKLQLAVSTPRAISPTELVVEHYHKDEFPSMGSAPKEIELWVEIKDEDAGLREEIRRQIKQIHPEIFGRGGTQNGQFLGPKLALGNSWVPIGRWVYQISSGDGGEEAQYFKIPVDLAAMGVVVQHQVVRINSNWGDVDRTCLVRVGLHGEDPSTPPEYLEDDDS